MLLILGAAEALNTESRSGSKAPLLVPKYSEAERGSNLTSVGGRGQKRNNSRFRSKNKRGKVANLEFELNSMNIVIHCFFKLSSVSILVPNLLYSISSQACIEYRMINFLIFSFFNP